MSMFMTTVPIFWLFFVRFSVRDYEYDPQALEAEKKEKERLERELKKQFVRFLIVFTNKIAFERLKFSNL